MKRKEKHTMPKWKQKNKKKRNYYNITILFLLTEGKKNGTDKG